ncbi:MAG: hypothetical protein CMK09_19255 [Ponticaulis sp.]|nr:hypothetical protein [Ponticaulis sp.]
MMRSSDVAPRILFLADDSLSMPQAFRGEGPKMVALKDRVAEIAKTIHPNAQVQLIRTNSNLWQHLMRHSSDAYNLIVYATDGGVGGRKPTPGDIEKLRRGPKQIVIPFMMRTGRLSGEDFMINERGLRVALFSTHGVVNTDKAVIRSDILPFAEPMIYTPNKERLLEIAFETSMGLAMVETGVFDTNTYTMLQGKKLVPVDYNAFEAAGLEKEEIGAWRTLSREIRNMFSGGVIALTAEGGETRAVWAICRKTGQIYGLLPDATGGGNSVERVKAQLAEVDRVVFYMNLLILAAGMAGGLPGVAGAGAAASLGVVAIYGQFLGRLYAAVAITIILMDSSGIRPAVRKAVAGTVCELKKHITLTIFGAVGKWVDRAVALYTVADSVSTITGKKLPINYSCSFD